MLKHKSTRYIFCLILNIQASAFPLLVCGSKEDGREILGNIRTTAFNGEQIQLLIYVSYHIHVDFNVLYLNSNKIIMSVKETIFNVYH
jgi:hypothetical protein